MDLVTNYLQLIGVIFDQPLTDQKIEKLIEIAKEDSALTSLRKNWSVEGGIELSLSKELEDQFRNFSKNSLPDFDQDGKRIYYQKPLTDYQHSRQLRFNYGKTRLRIKDGLSWSRSEIQLLITLCQKIGIKAKGCYCNVSGDWTLYDKGIILY